MSKQTESNFFIVSPLKSNFIQQQMVSEIVTFRRLGNKLTYELQQARAFCQVDKIRELSPLLINFPIKEFRLIGQYYLAWCDLSKPEFLPETLDKVIEQSITYKAKALLARGASEGFKGDLGSAAYFYVEALKASTSLSERVTAIRSMSFIKSLEGFHKSALRDLESLLPIIKYAEPLIYFDFLNSYAVELGEAGYKQEARNIIKHVLESPFAFAYPEWQDTANDLREPNRSFVAISSSPFIPHNVLDMPATEHGESEQEINGSDSIQSPLSLDGSDDNVLEFPHLVDLEKLERESNERFNAEMERFAALIDNCQLHDFVDSILIGDMNPARFARFLLRMSKFEDIKMVQDVFHWMLRYTFNNSDEYKESETEWTERLLKEIESTDTL